MSPINQASEGASLAWGMATAAAGAVAPSAWELTTGLPTNVVIMALAGTLLALRWTTFEGSRLLILFGILVNTGISAGLTIFTPHIPGFGWLKTVPAPVVALVGAMILQLTLPLLIPVLREELPKRVREFKLRRNP